MHILPSSLLALSMVNLELKNSRVLDYSRQSSQWSCKKNLCFQQDRSVRTGGISEPIFCLILELDWKSERRKFGRKDDKFGESKLISLMGDEGGRIRELLWPK